MDNLTYIDNSGNVIFKAQYHRNRGTCCRSNCLHCPFGTTLKNLGLSFQPINLNDISAANDIIADNTASGDTSGSDITSMLLGNAFGKKATKTPEKLSADNYHQFEYVVLKDHIVGVIKIVKKKIIKNYLKPEFDDQGIDQDIIQSYYNS